MPKPLPFIAIVLLSAVAAVAPLRAQVFKVVDFPYAGDSLLAFAPGPAGDVYALLHPRYARDQLYLIRRGGGVVAQPHLRGAFETSPDTAILASDLALATWPQDRRRVLTGRTGARPGNPLTARSGLETVVAGPSGRVTSSLEVGYPYYFDYKSKASLIRGKGSELGYVFITYEDGWTLRRHLFPGGDSLASFYTSGGVSPYRTTDVDFSPTGIIVNAYFDFISKNKFLEFYPAAAPPAGVRRTKIATFGMLDSPGNNQITTLVQTRFVSPTRVIAVGWAVAAQRLLSWNVDLARSPISESNVGKALDFPAAGQDISSSLQVAEDFDAGLLYLAYVDESVPGRRTLTVRSLKFGSTTTEVVMAHSVSDVKTFRSFRFDAGNLLFQYEDNGGASRFIYAEPSSSTLPRVSFPTGVPAEACFGESLTVDTDYTGVGPGVVLAYNFGCGPVVAKRSEARTREVITVNCDLAPGTCASRTLSIYAVSHKDSILLNEYPIRICGAATVRDTVFKCGAPGFTTVGLPDTYRDSTSVSDDCSVTRLITVRTPSRYDAAYRVPCDTVGLAAKYDSIVRQFGETYGYDADGGPGGCPITRRLDLLDNAAIAFDLGVDTIEVGDSLTIPAFDYAGIEYAWENLPPGREFRDVGRGKRFYYATTYVATVTTPSGCRATDRVVVRDRYQDLGVRIDGSPGHFPAGAATDLCGVTAFHSDNYVDRNRANQDVDCWIDAGRVTVGKWYSLRTDDSGELSFTMTAGQYRQNFQPIYLHLFEEIVQSSSVRENLLFDPNGGCYAYYYREIPQLPSIAREVNFDNLRPNTIYWLRVAASTNAGEASGMRYSFADIRGIAAPSAMTPPIPTVRLAPGESGVVDGDRCAVELDVRFDPTSADYVELYVADQAIRVDKPGIQTVSIPSLRAITSADCQSLSIRAVAVKGCSVSSNTPDSERPTVSICRPARVTLDTTICNDPSPFFNGIWYYSGRSDFNRGSVTAYSSSVCVPDTNLNFTAHPYTAVRINKDTAECERVTYRIVRERIPLGYENYTYEWRNLDTDVAAESTTDVAVLTVPGRYRVTATYGDGCAFSEDFTVIDCTTPLVTTSGLTVKVWLPGGVRYDSIAWYVEGVRVGFAPGGMVRYVRSGSDTLVYTLAAAGTYKIEALAYKDAAPPVRYTRTVTVTTSGVAAAGGKENDLRVFPNPTSGLLRYTIDGLSAKREAELVIYNQVGAGVQVRTGASEGELDVSALPSGAYTLVVQVEGAVRRARFVKL